MNFQNNLDFGDNLYDTLEMNHLVNDQFSASKSNFTSEMPQSIFFDNLNNGISKMTKQPKTSHIKNSSQLFKQSKKI